ncbi:30S ribosomal protein s7 chloroplastic [Phtheirospermum japonicum]|uniref:30S ribosomal protein s7 chloroplastic n=1 Tax=Phtheirospermum japonicum TaxID=374723 RepID=A0A830D5K1_9LAMI|nr:30S ribosomal protein s7 chloroplastic [Phtheirospermum japonicum]
MIHTRKSTCHPLVISGIPKTFGSKYGFQIKFRISGCCQREWRCHTQKGRDS